MKTDGRPAFSPNFPQESDAGMKTRYINEAVLPLVQVLMETDNAGIIQATYSYGNDLISMNRSSVNAYYHYDGLGSVRQMTDSTGTVVTGYTYDAFGNQVAFSIAIANAYGFTGEQQLGEADDLVYLRARYYDPKIGRFTSRDPILASFQIGPFVGWILPYTNLIYSPQSLSPYVYVQNNPVNLKDPYGLVEIADIFVWNPNVAYTEEECMAYCAAQALGYNGLPPDWIGDTIDTIIDEVLDGALGAARACGNAAELGVCYTNCQGGINPAYDMIGDPWNAGSGDGGIDWGSSNKGVIIGLLLLLICLSNYLKDKHNVQ